MFKSIKYYVLTVISLVLMARFFVAIGDYTLTGSLSSQALPIYKDWRSVIQMLYSVSDTLAVPVLWIYQNWVAQFIPPTVMWFPVYNGPDLLRNIQMNPSMASFKEVVNNPTTKNLLAGQYQWLALVAIGFYKALDPLLDNLYEFLRNLVWNVFIENAFTKKKQDTYHKELEQRATDILKLKVEYKNLSKENSVLAETVIKDELTGLFNKRFYIQRAKDEFQAAKQQRTMFSIVMIDIDHFKRLNDTYGHLMGDKVLKKVAETVGKLTPKGCYPCRFGGEEFAVIMPNTPPDRAYQISQRIHVAIPALKFEDDPELKVTISMGLLSANFANTEAQAFTSFEDTVQLADDELYRAKLGGRNLIQHKIID